MHVDTTASRLRGFEHSATQYLRLALGFGNGHDGFAISVPEIGYAVMCPDPDLPPAEPSCTLTGGNRQFHPTH